MRLLKINGLFLILHARSFSSNSGKNKKMKQLDVDVSPPAKYHELNADLESSDL